MSDTENTTNFDPVEPNADEDQAVNVFGDAEDFDLRPGADSCYKCSSCDTSCPVAEVDDDFPGPKFQGPGKSSSTSATGQLVSQDEHL